MAIDEPRDLQNLLNDPYAEPELLTYKLIQKITQDFTTSIGSGRYGDVYLGLLEDKKFAVKIVKYTDQKNIDEQFRNEVDCFKRVKHENIARLLGYCEEIPREMTGDANGTNNFVEMRKRFLCLEYAPCGDLQGYIEGKFQGDDWTTYYQMFMGICLGLEHIHKKGIIHLDLNPKNVLLDAYMRTKITDFGSAKRIAREQSTVAIEYIVGTEGFMAPEMKTNNEISYKSDIYALGATIATLLMGNSSKDHNKEKWLAENLGDDNCPKEKRNFIDIAYTCMKHDPNERKTIQEIIDQLRKMGLNDHKMYDSEDVIKVDPQVMRFGQIGPENVVSSTLNIVNRIGQYVAYKISWKNTGVEHIRDIIGPHETRAIDMPRETSERFLVQSFVVTERIDKPDIPADMFDIVVQGRRIYEVEVGVFVEGDSSLGNTSSQHLCLPEKNSNQIIPTLARSSVAAVLATSSEDPTSVPGINEIYHLMSNVDKLAQKVPTTGERLSRISGLFPPGHGPCVEAVQETTNCDVDVLQNLKLAIFNIQDSFLNLGKKQDEICREFEKEAMLIERQMNQQDDVAAFAAAEEAKGAEASGNARAAANYMARPFSMSSELPINVSGINEIDKLMSMVEELAQKVPTTGERLSRISGLFPPGHGPCVEAIQEASNHDVDVLNNLKLSIAIIRDIFVDLGGKQDEICVEFEHEAVLIERQMNQQDDVAAAKVNGSEASGYARAANYMEEGKDTEESFSPKKDYEAAKYVSPPESPPEDYSDDEDETSEDDIGNDNINYAN